ncbi:hypothetical protein MAF45_07625 [Mesosutterella sp. OilRF-GAM-744-9]|uniref:Uncharacterized protein n=1 Tax=Mesosutterella porci TaxID=2915351 RepID=A0ABS9MRP9_9BURK|nr:hypothetical protein [Mesosutterella sp. oilRF-744-WT-GAM-9]MCG5031308.1 hypothetical protein [Mesosutterella sp. oilRF-744-WT-GAM-9]
MWVRTLIVAFGLAMGIGLCAYVARRLMRLGGRGAAGTALRWGLFPLALFLVAAPLLAMHGLLRAIAGMTLLVAGLCAICFLVGLVIGLWKESLRNAGPYVLDPTIALNRPPKKFFAALLVVSLAGFAPWLFSYSVSLILLDLTDLSLNSPKLVAVFEDFSAKVAPAGAVSLAAAAVSGLMSLGYDWTLGAVIERILTAREKRRP